MTDGWFDVAHYLPRCYRPETCREVVVWFPRVTFPHCCSLFLFLPFFPFHFFLCHRAHVTGLLLVSTFRRLHQSTGVLGISIYDLVEFSSCSYSLHTIPISNPYDMPDTVSVASRPGR